MITEVCAHLHNYFTEDEDKHFGKFKISGGELAPLEKIIDGQYIRIVGSKLNDGIYQYPVSGLADEEFNGAIWGMNVPPSFVSLCAEIKKYNDEEKPSVYVSENYGGYSYSKATDTNGAPATWETVYRNRLNKWRKIR